MLTGTCVFLQAPALAVNPCSPERSSHNHTSLTAVQPMCTSEPRLALTGKGPRHHKDSFLCTSSCLPVLAVILL